ncbi:hypothetical protein N566_20525 [Streptomycetaceae bacterium MP113-05]|nr:hypothetical protein N566_20525 [Streptomycetaceae bacterium MP113-05]
MVVDARARTAGTLPVLAAPGSGPRAALSRALAVPFALGLVAVLPGWVATQPGPGAHDEVFWLQLTVCCYAGARLTAMVLSARRRLVQGSFWLFVYIAMGIAPLAQTVLDRVPTPVVGPRSDTTAALALVLVGVVAFDVGALLARHRPSVRRIVPQVSASVHRRRLYAFVVFSWAASILMVVRLGGPGVFFSSRQEISESLAGAAGPAVGATVSQAGTAFLRGFGTVPALLALLLLTRWLVTSPAARRRPLVPALWVVTLGVNAVVNNPVSNPRYWFLTVLFALLFTAFPRSPVMYRSALALGAVVALVVFPFADRFRYADSSGPERQTESVLVPLTLKDYDQVGMIANTVSFAEAGTGHTYGRQLSGTLLFFVPRSVWDGKPEDSGVRVGEWMGMNNTNLSSPLWAELWLDFGPFGIVVGFLAVGYAASRADRRYVEKTLDDPSPGNVMAVVNPLVAGYGFILLRGPLLQASGRVAIAVLCLAMVTTFRPDPRKMLP